MPRVERVSVFPDPFNRGADATLVGKRYRMPEMSSWLAAFILSFWASRAAFRLPLPLRSLPRLVASHAIAGLALFGLVGLLKAYFVVFAFDQAMVVLYTQIFWMVVDIAITGARQAVGDQGR